MGNFNELKRLTVSIGVVVFIALPQCLFAQSIGWVMWSYEESTTEYTSGRKERDNKWAVDDAFENFGQCKKSATGQNAKALKYHTSARGPIFENASISIRYSNKFTEDEQKRSFESTLELMKDVDKPFLDFIKRNGPMKERWGLFEVHLFTRWNRPATAGDQ
jgi:hypothetical protein